MLQNTVSQRRTVPKAAPQAVRIPDIYAPDDKQSFLDMFKESPIYTIGIRGFFGPLIDHPIASILTWFGCGWLLDKYVNAGGGEYNKSLFKKVVNFGDKIQNSKFVQSKPMQTVLSWFKKGSKKGGNIVDKNSVLKAMRDTPTMPELEIVKSEMLPQRQRIVHDFNHIVNELHLSKPEGFAKLSKLALSKEDTKALKEAFNVTNIADIPEAKASSFIQLKRLGRAEDFIKNAINTADNGVAITKAEIFKEMGGKNPAWLKAVQEDTIGKYVNDVQGVTKRLGGKVKISLGNYRPFGLDLGFLTSPTKRIISCDNIYNRLYSLDGGAKTATGRFMSRFVQMVHRGLTFGGGKLGVLLFIAPALVETAINVHKAEPNEKIGTGVNNLVGHISWVFTFPLALQIMHHVCGAQNAGLSKETVQKIRKLQNDFNKKNARKGKEDGEVFKDYEEYNKERKRVNAKMKELRTVKGQKWYTRLTRKLASFITPDLGKLDAYNPGNMVTRTFSKMRNLPRNMVGVPLRLILFIVLTMGVLDTAINKTLKFFFGGSYDSAKEEERKDAKKEQKKFLKEDLTDRLYEAQRQKIIAMAQNNKQNSINKQNQGQNVSHRGGKYELNQNELINSNSEQTNFAEPRSILHNNEIQTPIQPHPIPVMNNMRRNNVDTYTYIPSQENVIPRAQGKGKTDTYTYIPSQNSTIKDKNGSNSSNTRSYIPSQMAANIQKNWDNSGLQAALARADRAEKRAMKLLAGDFEDMP